MDGALQAGIGFLLADRALRSRGYHTACAVLAGIDGNIRATPATAWVYVRANAKQDEQRHAIDVYDETGRLCLRLRGLASRSRMLAGGMAVSNATFGSPKSSQAARTLLLVKRWRDNAVARERAADAGRYESREVLVGAGHADKLEILKLGSPSTRWDLLTESTIVDRVAEIDCCYRIGIHAGPRAAVVQT